MKKTIRDVIAENVKQHMTEQSHTQASLSAESGIPKTKIRHILAGTVDCNVDEISALARAFGVKSSALLEDPAAANERAMFFQSKLLSLPPEARARVSQLLDAMTAQAHGEAHGSTNTHSQAAI